MRDLEYPIVVIPLSEEEGGGHLGLVPDLNGCMSDGQTREEALANTQDAIREWLHECERLGREIPSPGTAMERAKARHQGLLSALKGMVDAYGHLDDRVERLSAELEHLREVLDNEAAWTRFADLTGVDPNGQKGGHRLPSC